MEAVKDYTVHIDSKKSDTSWCRISVLQCKRVQEWLYYS